MRESTASTTAALQREVKLPPFEEERPSAWFKSAEVMFELHGVANRKMWFFYTQWALTSQQKMLVDDIICMDPAPPDAYEILKPTNGGACCVGLYTPPRLSTALLIGC